jgi:cytochrome c-type biogenesis protein CcmH
MWNRTRNIALALALAVVALAAMPVQRMLAPVTAHAVEPDEMLKDPKLEARARRISQQLRCLVCQNENIDESNADLARDIRILLRERLKAGDTDEQAIQYLVDRYGEYVLLKPRFAPHTLILWVGPFLLLGIGLFAAAIYLRRRVRAAPEAARVEAPLSEEERKRLQELLDGS